MRLRPIASRAEPRRHHRKYAEGELGEDKSFYFRGPEGRLHLRGTEPAAVPADCRWRGRADVASSPAGGRLLAVVPRGDQGRGAGRRRRPHRGGPQHGPAGEPPSDQGGHRGPVHGAVLGHWSVSEHGGPSVPGQLECARCRLSAAGRCSEAPPRARGPRPRCAPAGGDRRPAGVRTRRADRRSDDGAPRWSGGPARSAGRS